MLNTACICHRSFKTLSIFVKLADVDKEKIEKLKINENFDLTISTREMLNSITQFMKLLQLTTL